MKILSTLVAAASLSFASLQGIHADNLPLETETFSEVSINANFTAPQPSGRYFVLSHVAFQGTPDKRFGWPAYAGSFEDAIRIARQHNITAFHYYVNVDSAVGAMYPFSSITGYEAREGGRQTVGVIMERKTVH